MRCDQRFRGVQCLHGRGHSGKCYFSLRFATTTSGTDTQPEIVESWEIPRFRTCDDCGLRWEPEPTQQLCPRCAYESRGQTIDHLADEGAKVLTELNTARQRISNLERELLASSAAAKAKPVRRDSGCGWDPEGL